jgi:hypothetical protein
VLQQEDKNRAIILARLVLKNGLCDINQNIFEIKVYHNAYWQYLESYDLA